ncbi:MAG TPA: penicillin-binding protein 1A [Steroidobacteraceae bacterium]|nr:penicillin-binding protein 1A [Steroidobacteraceae bacterium]
MKSRGFRIIALLAGVALAAILLGGYALIGSYVYLEPSLPTPENMRNVEMQVPLRVYTRNGELIAQIGEQRRVPVEYNDIPVLVREAFLAAEDDRFFKHHGIDFAGVLRAVFVDLFSGGAAQGASTITQQAARNMFLTLEKTWRRKLSELFVTLRMEHEFSKEQILGLYLNVIFFGQRSYGVAAAAEAYFGKSLDELSVAEIATLAGLPQAPSRYNPVTNPKAAAVRRHYVLQRMSKLHFIDAATAAHADAEPVVAREHAPLFDVEAPYVAEMVRAEIVARYGEEAINAGYKVYTTLDGRLQIAANRAVRLGLIEYDRRHGYRGPKAHISIGTAVSEAQFEAALADVPTVGILEPAVVVSVGEQSARVYLRGGTYAQIDWIGMSWARKQLSLGGTGPSPKHAADVVQRGDVIYVVSDGKGEAQLAQVPEAQSALIALDPQDGAIAALVGGFDYFDNKFNRVTQALRQPGSGFKPFLYSAALENGFTPSSVIMDAPIMSDDRGAEQAWRPENSSGDFGGPMRLREALARSRNLVSIRILRQIGIDTAIDYATRFGFDRKQMPASPTLALGTMQATPLQVAAGYAVLANGGFRVEPYFIQRIDNANGTTLWQAAPKIACAPCELANAQAGAAPAAADGAAAGSVPEGSAPVATPVTPQGTAGAVTNALPGAMPQIVSVSPAAVIDPDRLPPLLPKDRLADRAISAANAWLMDDILGDVIRRGTGRGALVLGRNDLSGKTGTTQDSRDNWFNGFNSKIVASVWVGFDAERSLGESEAGASTALPIWVQFMRQALRGVPDVPRPQPPGLVTARISPTTGLLATDAQSDSILETFLADHLPVAASGVNSSVPSGTPGSGTTEPLF